MTGRWHQIDVTTGEQWSVHLVLQLAGCDHNRITDPEALATWLEQLIERIEMTPFGEPVIDDFGHKRPQTSGYTVSQLIEESNITAHFVPFDDSAKLDVHSCAPYVVEEVVNHAMRFFKAKDYIALVIQR